MTTPNDPVSALSEAIDIIETGDQRLLARDGDAGGLPPDLSRAEWRRLYLCVKRAHEALVRTPEPLISPDYKRPSPWVDPIDWSKPTSPSVVSPHPDAGQECCGVDPAHTVEQHYDNIRSEPVSEPQTVARELEAALAHQRWRNHDYNPSSCSACEDTQRLMADDAPPTYPGMTLTRSVLTSPSESTEVEKP